MRLWCATTAAASRRARRGDGIAGMRERALHVGGALTPPGPGRGTEVRLDVPVPEGLA